MEDLGLLHGNEITPFVEEEKKRRLETLAREVEQQDFLEATQVKEVETPQETSKRTSFGNRTLPWQAVSTLTGKPDALELPAASGETVPSHTDYQDPWSTVSRKGGQAAVANTKAALGGAMRFLGETGAGIYGIEGVLPDFTPEEMRKGLIINGDMLYQEGVREGAATAPHVAKGSLKAYVYQAIPSILQSGLALGATAATGGSNIPLIFLSAISGSSEYGAQRAAGLDFGTSVVAAIGNGIAEFVGEKLPFDAYLKGPASFANFLKGQLFEVVGEQFTNAIQSGIEAMTRNPEMTFEELVERIRDTAVVSLITGTALGGASQTAQHLTTPQVQKGSFEDPETSMAEYIKAKFPTADAVSPADYGYEVKFQDGKTLEIHLEGKSEKMGKGPNDPDFIRANFETLAESWGRETAEDVLAGRAEVPGVYFPSGTLSFTRNQAIYLARSFDKTTLPHEIAHFAEDAAALALTPEEYVSLLSDPAFRDPKSGKYSSELFAIAHGDYIAKREGPATPIERAFQKIADFYTQIVETFLGPTSRGTMERIRSGEAFMRQGRLIPTPSAAMFEVTPPEGFPEHTEGFQYDGTHEELGLSKYKDSDPGSPSYGTTITAKTPEEIGPKARAARQAYTRTPQFETRMRSLVAQRIHQYGEALVPPFGRPVPGSLEPAREFAAEGRRTGWPAKTTERDRQRTVGRLLGVLDYQMKHRPRSPYWWKDVAMMVRRLANLRRLPDGKWAGNIRLAEDLCRMIAFYSPNTTVEQNAADFVKAIHSLARGEPLPFAKGMGERSGAWAMPVLDADLIDVSERGGPKGYGPKVMSMFLNVWEEVFGLPDSGAVTNDRYMNRAAELKNKSGGTIASPTEHQYKYVRDIILEVTDKYNAEHGTKLQPKEAQAAIWDFVRDKEDTFGRNETDFSIYMGIGNVTAEMIPAFSSREMEWIHKAPFHVRRMYTTGAWRVGMLDENENNIFFDALGLPLVSMDEGRGSWEGIINPNMTLQQIQEGARIAGFDIGNITLMAAIIGYIGTQEMVPWFRAEPWSKDASSPFGFSIREAETGRAFTPEELELWSGIVRKHMAGQDFSDILGDVVMVNYNEAVTEEEFQKAMMNAQAEFSETTGLATNSYHFRAPGDYSSAGWGEQHGENQGEGHLQRIAAAGRQDLLSAVRDRRDAVRAYQRDFSKEHGVQFQVVERPAEYPPIDRDELIERSVNGLGVTSDWRAAGWILPDGRMINIRDQEYFGEHRRCAKAIGLGERPISLWGYDMEAIRVYYDEPPVYGTFKPQDVNYLNIEMYRRPNQLQIDMMKRKMGPNTYTVIEMTHPYSQALFDRVIGDGTGMRASLDDLIERNKGAHPSFQVRPTVFVSKLRAVAANLPEKIKSESLVNFLKKYQVKDEEIKWSGLHDLLAKAKPGTQISREDVLNHIAQNSVRVQEKILGGPKQDPKLVWDERYTGEPRHLRTFLEDEEAGTISPTDLEYTAQANVYGAEYNIRYVAAAEEQKYGGPYGDIDDPSEHGWTGPAWILSLRSEGFTRNLAAYQSLEEAKIQANLHREANFTDSEILAPEAGPKFESNMYLRKGEGYMGGENYFELLLTIENLPHPGGASLDISRLRFEPITQHVRGPRLSEVSAWYTPEGSQSEVLIGTYTSKEKAKRGVAEWWASKSKFNQAHWSHDNIFASALADSRTDEEGNRVLFIHEIQSDWAIAGRKRGFMGTPTEHSTGESVPPAPYVMDGSWMSMIVRRMIRYAIDTGHNKIAWSPGEIVANRWNLAQHFEAIYYKRAENENEYTLLYVPSERTRPVGAKVLKDHELDDWVGGSVADRIRASEGPEVTLHRGTYLGRPGQTYMEITPEREQELNERTGMNWERGDYIHKGYRALKGEGLRGGKSWPFNLYDKTVPGIVESVGKKYGVKVKPVNLTRRQDAYVSVQSVSLMQKLRNLLEWDDMDRIRRHLDHSYMESSAEKAMLAVEFVKKLSDHMDNGETEYYFTNYPGWWSDEKWNALFGTYAPSSSETNPVTRIRKSIELIGQYLYSYAPGVRETAERYITDTNPYGPWTSMEERHDPARTKPVTLPHVTVHGATIPEKMVHEYGKAAIPLFQVRKGRFPGYPDGKGLTFNMATDQDVIEIGKSLLRELWEKIEYRVPHDETERRAIELIKNGGINYQTIATWPQGKAFPSRDYGVAATMLATESWEHLKAARDLYRDGRIEKEEAVQSITLAMMMARGLYLGYSEVGGTLEARKIPATSQGVEATPWMQQNIQFVRELSSRFEEGGVSVDDFFSAVDALKTPEQAAVFARGIENAKDLSALNKLFYFSLLSNPVTQAANILGNVGPLFISIFDQKVGELLYGAKRGGASGMAAGLYHSLYDAMLLTKRAALTGETSFRSSKVDERPYSGIPDIDRAREAIRAIKADPTHPFNNPNAGEQYKAAVREMRMLHRQAWDPISKDRIGRLPHMDADGPMARVVDLLGKMVDIPFQGLTAGDEFFKVVNERMFVWGRAYEEAAATGLDPGTDAFNEFVADFVNNPTDEVKQLAAEFADKQTFTGDVGFLASRIMEVTREYPIARLFIPFVRVVSNLVTYGVEHTPLANLLLRQVREDIRAGGRARQVALSKMTTGATMVFLFGALAMSGAVTGGGPLNRELKKRMKENGWQEYSFRIGGKYYSYKRWEPLAGPIGVIADLMEVGMAAPEVGMDELFLMAMLAGFRNFTSKTFMIGAANALEFVTTEDPNLKKYFSNVVGIAVPAGVAQVARMKDPVFREVNSYVDKLKSRTPGLSDTLPPRRGLNGQPLTFESHGILDMVNPIYTSRDKNDPVYNEIIRNQVKIGMPSKYIMGYQPDEGPELEAGSEREGIPLPPEAYDWLVRMAGNELKDPDTGLGAWDLLTQIVLNHEPVMLYEGKPIYYKDLSDGPDGSKAFVIKRVIDKYRSAAKRQLQDPEGSPFTGVAEAARQKRVARKQALQPSIAGGGP